MYEQPPPPSLPMAPTCLDGLQQQGGEVVLLHAQAVVHGHARKRPLQRANTHAPHSLLAEVRVFWLSSVLGLGVVRMAFAAVGWLALVFCRRVRVRGLVLVG
jgi:hypothetical protein